MRLGSIQFINSLPVDGGLLSGEIPFSGQVIQGSPVDLNEKILRGELDVSPVSALWYGMYQDRFTLLPSLSISSESAAQSVLLFSRKPLELLKNGSRVIFSGKGRTTPALLEIICRLRYGVKPVIETAPIKGYVLPPDADAMLVIGDEALLAYQQLKSGTLKVTDLAQEWYVWTGLPIVFAVWAVRKDVYAKDAQGVHKAHEAILRSKQWGAAHLDWVLDESERRSELPRQILRAYFSALSYDFSERSKKGMTRYMECARECGLIGSVPVLDEIKENVTSQ